MLELLFRCADEFGWNLEAWSILNNHYHFIAKSPEDPQTLRRFLGKMHMLSSKEFNLKDETPGRKVWYQYHDSHITFEKSYLARLNYIHNNPVKHGVVDRAENYKWCSAAWFEQSAPKAFVATVQSFKTDRLEVGDDF
jgi:putative transposase